MPPLVPYAKIVEQAIHLAAADLPSVSASTNTRPDSDKYQRHADLQTRILALLPSAGVGILKQPTIYASVEHREEQAQFALDMYEDRQVQYLDKNPGETPEEFERRRGKFTCNWTAAVIDTLARLYDDQPRRTTDSAEFTDWATDIELDALMQQVERYTTLQGCLALVPYFDEEEGKITLRIKFAHQIRTVPNEMDPEKPLAVVIRWVQEDLVQSKLVHYATVYTNREIIPLRDFKVWTDAVLAARESGLQQGESGKGYENPYKVMRRGELVGMMPVVLTRFRPVGDDFHVDGLGQAVADKNAELNNLSTGTFNQANFQAFTPVVALNREASTPLRWGPGALIDIRVAKGEQGGLVPVGLDSHIAELMELYAVSIKNLLASMRIPEAALHATADSSGVSITVANTPLMEFRKQSIPRYRKAEKRLHLLWHAMMAVHYPDDFAVPDADDLALSVQWDEPQVAVTAEARATEEDRAMKLGLMSPVDLELRDNADAYADIEDGEARRTAAMAALMKRIEETRLVVKLPPAGFFARVDGVEHSPDDDAMSAGEDDDPEAMPPGEKRQGVGEPDAENDDAPDTGEGRE